MGTVITQNYHGAILCITYRHCARESPRVAAASIGSPRCQEHVCSRFKVSREKKEVLWEKEEKKRTAIDTVVNPMNRWILSAFLALREVTGSLRASDCCRYCQSDHDWPCLLRGVARRTPLSPAQSRLNSRCYIFRTNVPVHCAIRFPLR